MGAGPQGTIGTALIASGLLLAFAFVDTILGVIKLSIAFGPALWPLLSTFVPGVLFAVVAFVVLAFLKPIPLNRPVAAVAVPLLIVCGIGFGVLLVFQVIFATIQSLDGGQFPLNIRGVVITAFVYTLVVGCGALFSRARFHAHELGVGATVSSSTIFSALIIAGVVLAESVIVSLLMSLGGINFVQILTWVGLSFLRGGVFAAAVFVILAFIRPLSRIRTIADVVISASIATVLGLVLDIIFGIVEATIQSGLDFYFPFTFFESVVRAIDLLAIIALAILVLLAWRGQRALMRPQVPQEQRLQQPGAQNHTPAHPTAGPITQPQYPARPGQFPPGQYQQPPSPPA